ncbi:MAG TPA: aquaporin [Candidatus Thermoplasmatota archaeon]|nr:aquaporin [Candidatus Thermoplasmatota archaeon]
MAPDLRPEAAEAVGTFLMLLVGGCAILAGQPLAVVALAFGGTVMVMVHALGHVCGAHFNPAVTVAFAATRHFPWQRVPTYIGAQLVGALAAAALLQALGGVGPVVARGSLQGLPAFAAEALATFLLAFVIAAVATDRRVPAAAAGLAIGGAVALGALAAGSLTGAAMNPARAIGPALVAGEWHALAPGVAGPLAGATAAMALYAVLRGARRPAAPGSGLTAPAATVAQEAPA